MGILSRLFGKSARVIELNFVVLHEGSDGREVKTAIRKFLKTPELHVVALSITRSRSSDVTRARLALQVPSKRLGRESAQRLFRELTDQGFQVSDIG